MTAPQRVVIVEDDFLNARYYQIVCEEHGAQVLGTAADQETALTLIRDVRPSHVLMDMRLQGLRDGVDIALQVNAEMPEVRIIFITGSSETPTIERINTDHPYRILIKPIDPDELRRALD